MKIRDPRITPARPDLASKRLEGEVEAERFVEAELRFVSAAQAAIRRHPSHDAPLDTEALRGELVSVFEDNGEGWSWGQLHIDGYVGWLPTEALSSLTELDMPTHRVSSLRTLIFPGPSIKLPPMGMLSYGCELAIKDMEGALAVTARDEYVPACHLADKDSVELDFVSIAERFVGTPYLWGGKTSLGIDCSGLVQVSLAGAGDPCPRDSDMQAEFLGLPVEPSFNFSNVQRGDFFFWTGHVAIARNSQTLIHANAFHMAVAIEPIDEAVRRIAEAGSPLKFVKRVSGILRQA